MVRVVQHDASRIEWVTEVALPAPGASGEIAIDFELEIPAHIYTPHDHWEHLEVRSRLASPQLTAPGRPTTIDGLRQDALRVAHQLKMAGERFRRRALLASSLLMVAPAHDVYDLLDGELAPALEAFYGHRLAARALPSETTELVTERRLVDEFLSNKLLDLLSDAEHAVDALLLDERCPHRDAYELASRRLRRTLCDRLERELSHRVIHGYATPIEDEQPSLEHYLDRASVLKKHFQEVLFLEVDSYWVDRRLRNWVGALVATVAALWAFLWQIYLTREGSSAGFGLLTIGTLGALVYAAKDRMKAVGNEWLAGRLTRAYADRVTRLRVPSRLLGVAPRRRTMKDSTATRAISTVRERFMRLHEVRADPLNPTTQRPVRTVLLRYRFVEDVLGSLPLQTAGFRSIKHIFRYDFTPLLSRLDDAVKRVPVLDENGRCVRFVQAPRCYRLPLVVRHRSSDGVVDEHRLVVVLHKMGVERVEDAAL